MPIDTYRYINGEIINTHQQIAAMPVLPMMPMVLPIAAPVADITSSPAGAVSL